MSAAVQALPSAGSFQRLPSTAIPLNQMLRPQYVGGKVGVSVRDFSVYTHFKHITAMPSADGAGYSASRLRMLDTLIDRLVKLKENSIDEDQSTNLGGMDSQAIDALIDEYARRYQQLEAQSSQGLSRDQGADFGISEGNNAMFLNIFA